MPAPAVEIEPCTSLSPYFEDADDFLSAVRHLMRLRGWPVDARRHACQTLLPAAHNVCQFQGDPKVGREALVAGGVIMHMAECLAGGPAGVNAEDWTAAFHAYRRGGIIDPTTFCG